MIQYRPAATRGRRQLTWLESRHSFSFAHYYDPGQMGYRSLRVLNEELLSLGAAFPPRLHHGMTIVTYVIAGRLIQDSIAASLIVDAGEVSIINAGPGLSLQQRNVATQEEVRFLQYWLLADSIDTAPQLRRHPATDQVLAFGQDANLQTRILAAGQQTAHALAPDRGLWLQVAAGTLTAAGQVLSEGDGLRVEDIGIVEISALTDATILLLDLGAGKMDLACRDDHDVCDKQRNAA